MGLLGSAPERSIVNGFALIGKSYAAASRSSLFLQMIKLVNAARI